MAQPTPIKQICHEPVVTLELGKHAAHFRPGEDHRDLWRTFRALEIDEIELVLQHLTVKEQQGAKGLILGRSCHPSIDRKMAEKSGYFFFAHFRGVPFFMKQDEAPDPLDVRLLGADAVALHSQMPANAVEQFRRARRQYGAR